MKKFYKILICVFAAGVLLCGLGFGVALTEISGLGYGGRQTVGDEYMKTENFDVKFEKGEEKTAVSIRNIYYPHIDVILDDKVPEDTVRFKVRYNSRICEPSAFINKDGEVILEIYYTGAYSDELEVFWQEKDVFLQSLKEGRLVSFYTRKVDDVSVYVNPANKADVEISDW